MTNRLELNWKLDGFVDEQRYYCSETPIDTNNLPAPKAILAGDVRAYTDTKIEVGKTYYVCVVSARGEVEKISNQHSIKTTNYAAYYPLTIDSNDSITAESFVLTGDAYINSQGLHLSGAIDCFASKIDSAATTIGGGEGAIGFKFKTIKDGVMLDNYNNTDGNWQIGLRQGGLLYFYDSSYKALGSQTYIDNIEHSFLLIKKPGACYVFVDNIQIHEFSPKWQNWPTKNFVTIGAEKLYPGLTNFKGTIRDLFFAKEDIRSF